MSENLQTQARANAAGHQGSLLTTPPIIRAPSVEDAQMIAEISESCFRETYAEHNTEANMQAYVNEHYNVTHIAGELADRRVHYFVAYHRGQAVGYAKLGSRRTPECVSLHSCMEIEQFYVRKAYAGQGIGKLLLARCRIEAGSRGVSNLWLGVWENNAKAIEFYQSQAFRSVGDLQFKLGDDVQRDLVMIHDIDHYEA